jgi:hypothetical protein
VARHRTDPRGGARITIAITAVIVVLTLGTVGGYALFTALTAPPTTTGAAATSPTSSPTRPAASTPSRPHVLAITVTGQQCHVFVATPGTTDIIIDQTLQHGESFFADQARLAVVVSDAGAVDILVNGVRRPPGRPGQRLNLTVTSDDTDGLTTQPAW